MEAGLGKFLEEIGNSLVTGGNTLFGFARFDRAPGSLAGKIREWNSLKKIKNLLFIAPAFLPRYFTGSTVDWSGLALC